VALHPVGPRPAATYWTRRAVLGGILVLLLVLVLLRSCGASPSRPAALTTTPVPAGPAAPATPSTAVTPTPTPPRPAASPSVSPTAGREACPDSSLALTASTDVGSYPLGSQPSLILRVRNTGRTVCRRVLGPAAVELLVYSANDRIYSSRDCTPATRQATVALRPGQVETTTLTWSGLRSLPGCAGSRAAATAGTYRVFGQLGRLRSAARNFLLTSG